MRALLGLLNGEANASGPLAASVHSSVGRSPPIRQLSLAGAVPCCSRTLRPIAQPQPSRCIAQLSLLGYILVPIFVADRWWLTGLYTVRWREGAPGRCARPLLAA